MTNLFEVYASGWNGWVRRHANPYPMGTTVGSGPEASVWEAGWLDARQADAKDSLNVGQRPARVCVLRLPSTRT